MPLIGFSCEPRHSSRSLRRLRRNEHETLKRPYAVRLKSEDHGSSREIWGSCNSATKPMIVSKCQLDAQEAYLLNQTMFSWFSESAWCSKIILKIPLYRLTWGVELALRQPLQTKVVVLFRLSALSTRYIGKEASISITSMKYLPPAWSLRPRRTLPIERRLYQPPTTIPLLHVLVTAIWAPTSVI